jgi:hypothetical protein
MSEAEVAGVATASFGVLSASRAVSLILPILHPGTTAKMIHTDRNRTLQIFSLLY